MTQRVLFDANGYHLTDMAHELVFNWNGGPYIEIERLEKWSERLIRDQVINVYDYAKGKVAIPFTKAAFVAKVNEWLTDQDEANNPQEPETPTLTERIEADGIAIVPELTETMYQNENTSWTWKVTIGIYEGMTYTRTMEIIIGNSVVAGRSTPDLAETVWHVISNAASIDEGDVSYREFIDWARELNQFDPSALESSESAWNHVKRAQQTYEHIRKETDALKVFLGDKYEQYLRDTEFDV